MRAVKNVQGGTATPSQFTIHVNGSNLSQSIFRGSSSGTNVTLSPGSYNVTEINGAFGYTPTYSSHCSGSIMAGQRKTCTVTNTFRAPTSTLNVIKHVDNTDFGYSQASSFQLTVTGNNSSPNTFSGSESGTAVRLGIGSYNVTESGVVAGYSTAYFSDCSGNIAAGQTKTCTVTNTAHFGQIDFVKKVNGTAFLDAFIMRISYTCDLGLNCVSGSQDFVSIPHNFIQIAGIYQITEVGGPSGYTPLTDLSSLT